MPSVPTLKTVIFAVSCVCGLPTLAQVPYMVKNLIDSPYDGSFPWIGPVTEFSGQALYNAQSLDKGTELWTSDGTLEGTYMAADFKEGLLSSNPLILGVFNNQVVMRLDRNSGHGAELWAGDGSLSGMHLIKDITPGSVGTVFKQPTAQANGFLFFLANDQLWRTDLTPEGTIMVADIKVTQLAAAQDRVYFIGSENGTPGFWMATGATPGATHLLDGYISALATHNQTAWFCRNSELGNQPWTSDGTPQGTVMIKQVQDSNASPIRFFAPMNGLVYFPVQAGGQMDLWVSDGTASGTKLQIDTSDNSVIGSAFHVYNDRLFFYSGGLYATDGTQKGTEFLGSYYPSAYYQAASTLYFINNSDLFKTDGTAAGTQFLWEGPTTSWYPLGVVGDAIYFRLKRDLWVYDGQKAHSLSVPASSRPGLFGVKMVSAGAGVVFYGQYARYDRAIYVSEGWETDTRAIHQTFSQRSVLSLNQDAYFFALSEEGDFGLWRWDGNESMLLQRYEPGGVSWLKTWNNNILFYPDYYSPQLYRYNTVTGQSIFMGEYYISALYDTGNVGILGDTLITGVNLSGFGNEPAAFNIGAPAPELIADINPNGDSSFRDPVTWNGVVYFSATDGSFNKELWRTDGTEEGTFIVKDIYPGSTGSNPQVLHPVNGHLLFIAENETEGRELWRTDGSEAGTVLVKDIYPGSGSSFEKGFELDERRWVFKDNLIYFTATDPQHGSELWVTDGTEAGTVMVKDINPGPIGSGPREFAAANGMVYFSASDGVHGQELWESDGTSLGSTMINDSRLGEYGVAPRMLTPAGDTLFFIGDNGQDGDELWAIRFKPHAKIISETSSCVGVVQTARIEQALGDEASYTWTIQNGTIHSDQTLSEIQYSANSTGEVILSVVVTVRGISSSDDHIMTAYDGSPATPGLITFSNPPCPFDQITLSVLDQLDATSFEWTLPPGAVFVSGEGGANPVIQVGETGGLVEVRAVNACGASSPSSIDLIVFPQASPANAGDGLVSCSDTVQLAASFPEVGQGTWRILSGMGGQVLEPNNPHSLMTGLEGETYTLEWMVSQPPCLSTSDTTQVVFTQPVEPANAGPDAVVCGLSLQLNANQPPWGIGRWSILSGVGGALSDENDPRAQFSGQVGQVYVLEWMVRGKPCDISTDQAVIQFEDRVSADAGEDRCVLEGSVLHLNAQATGGQGSWSVRSGPDLSLSQFQDPHHPRSSFTPGGGAGFYELAWSVNSDLCPNREDVVLVSVVPQDQLPQQVSRIPAAAFGNDGSNSEDFVVWNNLLFFTAQNSVAGRELWVYDGIDTKMIADMFPGGLTDQGPEHLTPGFDALYFTAFDPLHGRELWRTDGTEAGTRLVLDLIPGLGSSNINNLVAVNDLIFFKADGEDGVAYLWRSDGTEIGTFPVISEDLFGSLDFRFMMAYNNFLILQKSNGIWVLDGSGSGLRFIYSGYSSRPAVFNGALYFFAAGSFNRWDGSQAYAQELFQHPDLIGVYNHMVVGNHLFFVGRSYEHGYELWRTDGSLIGTLLVKDIAPNSQSGLLETTTLFNVGNSLFFKANGGFWRSDGTFDGTVQFADFDIHNPIVYDNNLWFGAFVSGPVSGWGLFKSDGTSEGTELFLEPEPAPQNSYPSPKVVLGNELIFLDNRNGYGQEPWVTDGALSGTRLLADIQPEIAVLPIGEQVVVNGLLIFSAGPAPNTLWRSDGTESGTFQIEGPEEVQHLHVLNNQVFFSADGPGGVEPWITDGSIGGTMPLADIVPGDSDPVPAAILDNELYFFITRFNKTELWRTNGTPGGTILTRTFGSVAVNQNEATALNGSLFFTASSPDTGYELWSYNSHFHTAQIWWDLRLGSAGSVPKQLMVVGERLFFTNYYESYSQRTLWSTDGTVPGTVPLEGLVIPGASDGLREFVEMNGVLYFQIEGRELWRSDGFQNGTWKIEDFQENDVISELTSHGGRLYFVENRPESGDRLLRSDGTWSNAHPVVEGSSPANLISFEDQLFFTARSPEAGRELWQTDGFCTVLAHDRNPGPQGSVLDHFIAGGTSMFYFAHDPQGASDLMLLDDPFVSLPDPAFRELILTNFDADNDQRLSGSEAATITSVNCFDRGVVTLKGVESMPNLTTLRAAGNNIGSLGPVVANPFLGTHAGDRIDIRSNLINVDDCADISLLNERRLAAASIFQLDPQKPQHGFPSFDQWPNYNVVDLIFGTLLDPGPIVCE